MLEFELPASEAAEHKNQIETAPLPEHDIEFEVEDFEIAVGIVFEVEFEIAVEVEFDIEVEFEIAVEVDIASA